MAAVAKRELKNEIKSPIEDQLCDSFLAIKTAHSQLKSCKNILHALLLEDIQTILSRAKYKTQESLAYLNREQGELSYLITVAKQDVVSAINDEKAQQAISEESKRFADALKALSDLTKTHLLLQSHFELFAHYSERYEESRLLPLSRSRYAFFESPTRESLARYLIQAEKLEDRGVAMSELRILFSLRLSTKNATVTNSNLIRESRRELLDELWIHSVLEIFPQDGLDKSRSLGLNAKRPHPGVHLQPSNGVILRRRPLRVSLS